LQKLLVEHMLAHKLGTKAGGAYVDTTVVDSEAKVQAAQLQVAPENLPALVDPTPPPMTQPKASTQLVIVDPELRQTQNRLATLRLWRAFLMENIAGLGLLAVGFHDLAFASSAIVSGIPAWQTVGFGLLTLGVAPHLVENIFSRFGAPKQ
jgi:hypothetical protein